MLILNLSYEPISVCGVRKAVILLLLNKAESVAAAPEKYIRSVNSTMPYPSVIRLKRFIHMPYTRVILTRKNILKRDGNRCCYCGRHDLPLTVDHVIPKARGGDESWENLVAACLPCNNRKSDRTPEEAGMKLRIKPFKPNHIMFMKYFSGHSEESWKPYLFYI